MKRLITILITIILLCNFVPFYALSCSANVAFNISEIGIKNEDGVLPQLCEGAVYAFFKGNASESTAIKFVAAVFLKETEQLVSLRVRSVTLKTNTNEFTATITVPKNPQLHELRIFLLRDGITPITKGYSVSKDLAKDSYTSVYNDSNEVCEILGSDTVFMATNDKYFASREKKSGGKSLLSDDTLYVSAKTIADAFSLNFSQSADKAVIGGNTALVGSSFIGNINLGKEIISKDGEIYIPAAAFCEKVMGQYVYEDERGFLLCSEQERNYSNDLSSDYDAHFEESDKIFAFMHYDRPRAIDIENALRKNGMWNKHPRIIAFEKDFADVTASIDKNSDFYNWLVYTEFLKNRCDAVLNADVIEYEIREGDRLFSAFVAIGDRIRDLGMAYAFTKEDKYALRAWREIENLMSWPDWNCKAHFLDSGMGMQDVMAGYDCIANYLTQTQREQFAKKVDELYFDYCIDAFEGSIVSPVQNICVTSNWGAVCGCGMLTAALTMIDTYDYECEFTERCRFIASQAIRLLEYQFGNIFPSGTTPEGSGYWEYIFSGLTKSSDMLLRLCGSDYGFLSSPGYDNAICFPIYMQKSNLGIWPFTDSDRSVIFPETLFLYAKMTNNKEIADALRTKKTQMNYWHYALFLLWNIGETTDKISLPLDYYAKNNEFTILQSSWDMNGILFGMSGGENTGHYDKGNFILEIDETEWFTDLGKDNYDLTGGNYWEDETRLKLYTKRAEGHNVLEINPSPNSFGQEKGAYAAVIEKSLGGDAPYGIYDLSECYGNRVLSYKRGITLADGRRSAVVQDELSLTEESTLYWYAHTDAEIEISADKKSAILKKDGKELRVLFYTTNLSDFTIYSADAEPLHEETYVEGEFDRSGKRKLCLKAEGAEGNVQIMAKFIPLTDENADITLSFKPLSQWQS